MSENNMTEVQNCGSFISVPLCYQETEYTCGVTCVQSILARYGIYYRQSALGEILRAQPIFGTDVSSIIHFVQCLGMSASLAENMDTSDIIKYIDAGIPLILIIQAWPDDDIEYPYDWKDAHYIIACGYYDHGIYAMDPFTLGNYTYLPFAELLKR
ncbi:MAG: hypothetical protein EOM54_14295 [Clostridia bacterium]|nr:hypothetical protein [Clostridia bacterium]